MTALAGNPHLTQPPTEVDHLGLALWRSLNRDYKNRFSLTPVRALIGGLLTFGIFPIFGLTRRLRNYIDFERQQMSHLAEWMRQHQPGADADALVDLSRVIRFREALYWLAVLCCAFTLVTIFVNVQPFSITGLIHQTYDQRLWQSSRHPPVFIMWNVALSIAYLFLWLQALYVPDLRRFVDQFNRVTTRQSLSPVRFPEPQLGLRIGWIAIAIILAAMGAFWGIPFALAGAAQRNYVNRIARQVHEQMADRVRLMMTVGGTPPSPHLTYRIHGPRCDRDACRSPLPAGAKFCPRCGAPTSGASA